MAATEWAVVNVVVFEVAVCELEHVTALCFVAAVLADIPLAGFVHGVYLVCCISFCDNCLGYIDSEFGC